MAFSHCFIETCLSIRMSLAIIDDGKVAKELGG